MSALAEALADVRAYIENSTGHQAIIETRPLADFPDCTAYQITGPTWGAVQRAIEDITLAPGIQEATFRNPKRVQVPDLRWQSRGYVRRRA